MEVTTALRENPFDAMGKVISTNPLTAQEIMTQTQTDWTVEKYPATGVLFSGVSGPTLAQPSSKHFVNVRSDNHQVIGGVGKRFTLIQNKDHAALVAEFLKVSGASLYNGWDLEGGEVVGYCALLPRELVIASEAIQTFFHLLNNHDGKGSLAASVNPYRNHCSNVLDSGRLGFRISHTTKANERLAVAQKTLKDTDRALDVFEKTAIDLSKAPGTVQDVLRIHDTLWPEPSTDTSPKGRVLAQWQTRRDRMVENYRMSPNIDNFRHTKWGVYNAVTEWAQWQRNFQGAGNNPEILRLRRGSEVLFGKAKSIGEKALMVLAA